MYKRRSTTSEENFGRVCAAYLQSPGMLEQHVQSNTWSTAQRYIEELSFNHTGIVVLKAIDVHQ